jgi:hypothetical protein
MNDVKTPTERFLSLTGIITKLHGHDHVITPEVEKLKRDLFNHALYAFSATSGHSIVCFAHVTNSMAQTEGDFEKGEPDGAKATLAVVAATARAWRSWR